MSRSAFSDSGTASGPSSTALAQLSLRTSTGVSSRSAPGTDALAPAIAAASAPIRRAASASRSALEANPQPDPMRARTPIPVEPSWVSPSISPLRADIDWWRGR